MSLLPGSSMSKQGIIKNIKERLWKPSKKRQKLGEDEDDWCDALNYLSLDSDDEYFDALEEQYPSQSLRTGTKRKKSGRKPSPKKESEMSRHSAQYSKAYTSGLGSKTTIDQPRQGSQLQSNSAVFRFGPQDSSTSTPMNTFPLGDEGYNTASSFSSESDVRAGFKWSPTMTGYADKGGIPDSKLEKLAKALPGEEYRNVRSLGQNLGFSLTKVYGYCGYSGKPKDSTGILRMLRDWKENTPDAKQISGLLEALKKANLKHLADDFHSQEGAEEQREAVQTSDGHSVTSPSKSVQPTTTRSDPLTDNPKSSPSAPSTSTTKKTEPFRFGCGRSNTAPSSSSEADVQVGRKQSAAIDDLSQSQLPMKDYTAKGGLTETKLKEVADAIGDNIDKIRLLGGKLGFSNYWIKKNLRDISGTLLMLHDWKLRTTKAEQMPKLLAALKSSQLQNVADLLHREQGFVKHPPDGDTPAIEINPEQPATTDDKGGKVCQEENQLSDKSSGWFGWLGNWFVWFVLFGWLPWLLEKAWPTRIPSIYICTSLGTRSIHGLKKKLQTSSDSSRCVVQELELPYNRLEDFKFPSKVNRTDAMILCHSVHNRGFSITDVQNSIYDEFLKNCNQVFGRDHMVVVVHDFIFNKEALKGHMETFQSMQPTTFKMAGLVVLAGKLDDTEVQLFQDDLTQLEKFVKKIC